MSKFFRIRKFEDFVGVIFAFIMGIFLILFSLGGVQYVVYDFFDLGYDGEITKILTEPCGKSSGNNKCYYYGIAYKEDNTSKKNFGFSYSEGVSSSIDPEYKIGEKIKVYKLLSGFKYGDRLTIKSENTLIKNSMLFAFFGIACILLFMGLSVIFFFVIDNFSKLINKFKN